MLNHLQKFIVYSKIGHKGDYMNEQIEEIMLELDEEIVKAINHQLNEYIVIRAGRANPHILDKVFVDYYGIPTPIKNMASITVPEARILAISVWDQSQVKNISKAISQADLGVTPNEDGKIIRLVFPMLTEERRIEIVKSIKKIAEESKIAVRNARRDAIEMIKDLEKDGQISEDERDGYCDDVQKKIDGACDKIDDNYKTKEKEIMEI